MKNAWNDNWRSELESTDYLCYIRLCECRNTRKDLTTMACLVYKYNKWTTPEECLIRILEWVGDWNGQFEVTDLTQKEYQKAVDIISKV